MDRDTISQHLEELGRQREDQREAQRDTATELAQTIRHGLDAGMTMTEICRLAGISRNGAYKLLDRQASGG